MLVYHPAFDLFHACFRITKLLKLSPNGEFEVEHLRLIDYFIVFPSEISKIQVPIAYKLDKKKFLSNKYNKVDNSRLVFERIKPYQDAALNCLLAYQAIDEELFSKNIIKLKVNSESHRLIDEIDKILFDDNLQNAITTVLLEMPFEGPLGLKKRSPVFHE